ncbi:hypothetical protein AWB70_01905 [Caballeronia cordobensis]|uniref:Uncharacterized protein n=1 Tax=Caballeronia cordobensis TaxID=1353886 RepID=A0A158GET9_CABCO|nr:hypothetical protein [Caballeronia cordobensis]SAL30634.1 hypothetical protein AWB70_01905 [Caballeronia cordobensis]
MIRPVFAVLLAVTLSVSMHVNAATRDTSHLQEANRDNFTSAVNDFLAKRGHLCLGKYNWPVYVIDADKAARTNDSLQMPVLEKLGLVTGKDMTVQGKDGGKKLIAHARQYSLTSEGEKYYLHIPEVTATGTTRVTHPADFCVATLTLDKVVGWEKPVQRDGDTMTSVLYTYKIEPARWARDPSFLRVFPMVQRVIEGEGTQQLREGMHLTRDGWVADEIFPR